MVNLGVVDWRGRKSDVNVDESWECTESDTIASELHSSTFQVEYIQLHAEILVDLGIERYLYILSLSNVQYRSLAVESTEMGTTQHTCLLGFWDR